jgi:hypothetical protein
MTHRSIYQGISGILNSLGYSQAPETDDFENVSSQQYGSTFILTCAQGEAGEANDTQFGLLYDNQTWYIQVCLKKTSQANLEQVADLHERRDQLIVALDNPANWQSFAEIVRYRSWEVIPRDSYYVLRINLRVIDSLSY